MKVFWFVVSFALFVGSFALFGYAFLGQELFASLGAPGFPFEATLFILGVLVSSIAFAIPFHLLEKFD